MSLFGSWNAYAIADKYGFSPQDRREDDGTNGNGTKTKEDGMIKKATNLFARVPVLGALFREILASQGLATVLNVCFVSCLGKAIPDDAKRAGWLGNFFAFVNLCTMVLQFAVLPKVISVVEPKQLWRAIPIISMLFTCFQAIQKDPSLYIVAASLAVMKISEYSARRMLDEMVFVP